MTTQSVDPRTGAPFGPVLADTDDATYEQVLDAAAAAEKPWADAGDHVRAAGLRAAADALDGAATSLVPLADRETGLGPARLSGELARTTFQLRMFADLAADGAYLDVVVDPADDRPVPVGHPDLRRTQVPLGVVAVYGASNFPFAFSVAGGDTASALAVGCPVVAKAHPAHPQLSEAVAELLHEALVKAGAPVGVLGLVRGFEAGRRLVVDPRVRAGAFTGSLVGGRALFDLAVSRPDPIPFYGELGSVNPVFVTPAAADRGDELVAAYLDSLTLGTGQFCTNPGVLVVPRAAALVPRIVAAAAAREPGVLLHAGVGAAFRESLARVSSARGVRVGYGEPTPTAQDGFMQGVVVLTVAASDALADPTVLRTECFGPAGVVVEYADDDEAVAIADAVHSCLAACVHGAADEPLAAELVRRLARTAGRVVWNGWPTGVAVTPAQHHGGPWPATTNPLHTSVGTRAVLRFLRPVAYQSMPEELLPPSLRGSV